MPMDLIIARTLALLAIAILVAIVARRLAALHGWTGGGGRSTGLQPIDTGIAPTHDIIFDVSLPPLLFELH